MRRLFLLLTCALAATACDDSPPAGSGPLTVSVTSPNGAEGAAQLRLVGPGLGAVSPVTGEVFGDARGDTLEVVVMRPDGGDLVFAVQVQDTTRKPQVELVAVAGPGDAMRAALSGYSVEVRR